MRAVVVDRSHPHRLAVADVAEPVLGPGDVLVGIERVGLHSSDLAAVRDAAAGTRLGRDFAGTVLRGAEDGSGPAVGTRVVGTGAGGSCAERHAGPASMLAAVPDTLELDEVACEPLPWLAAWSALARTGFGFGRTLLVLDAASRVGQYACQLGQASGMPTCAVVSAAHEISWVRGHGLRDVRTAVEGRLPSLDDLSGTVELVVDGNGRVGDTALRSLRAPDGLQLRIDLSVRRHGSEARLGRAAKPTNAVVRPLDGALTGREGAGKILSRLLTVLATGELVTPLGPYGPPYADSRAEIDELIGAGTKDAFLNGIRLC